MRPYRTNDRPHCGRTSVSAISALIATLFVVAIDEKVFASQTSTIAHASIISLDEAYARARARSDELAALDERITDAEINVDRAWALLKPTWNASFTFTHTEPEPPELLIPAFPNLQSDAVRMACESNGMGGIVDPQGCVSAIANAFVESINSEPRRFEFFGQDTALFSTTVTWNVFNGRALPAIASARDTVELERDRARASTLDLLLAVARAYYASAAAKQAIGVAERARDRAKAELAIAEKQIELGETVRARVLAAKIAAHQASLDVERAKNAHGQALIALHLLTRSDDDPDVLVPPPPDRPPGTREELLKVATSRRDDLKAASIAVRISERLEDEAWWRFAPVFSLFGSYRYSNIEGVSGQNSQWAMGVVASLVLYDGGLRYAELDSAQSKIRSAERAFAALREKISSDISRALLAVEASEISRARAGDALELAKQRAEVTAAQYEVGALRTIELQQANDAVLDAELAIIRADLDRALAILELQRAVGVFAP